MPQDQRKAYQDALWRCDELEKDIMQMAQDMRMPYGEVQLVLSRVLFRLCNEGLFVDHEPDTQPAAGDDER